MIYLIYHFISLFIFWAFYQIFLKKDTFFERNRWYLLLSLGIALLAPFLEIPLTTEDTSEIIGLQTFVLPEIGIKETETMSWAWFEVLRLIYFLGIAISLILFGLRLGKLLLLIQRRQWTSSQPIVESKPKERNLEKALIVIPYNEINTFSFFNYLFWDSSQNLTKEEEKQILEHELAHIKGGHSYDLIFMELQKIVFWFNPLIYLYQKELINQHEFIADSKALKHSDTESYISLMVSSLFKSLQIDFTHSFHNQQIKQRIKMLNTEKTTKMKGNAKTVLAIALVAIVTVAVACTKTLTNIEKDQNLSEMKVTQGQSQRELLQAYSQELQAFGKKYPTLFEGEKTELNDVAQLNMEKIEKKDKERISFLFSETQRMVKELNQERAKMEAAKAPDKNGVYTMVDKMAQPIDGMQEMFKQIGEEMTYPAQAREAGIEGKVYVQFVVNLDGSLTDIEIVKGIGAGCDAEAMRVIATTKWIAGEQDGRKVKQRMVMPIVFKLD